MQQQDSVELANAIMTKEKINDLYDDLLWGKNFIMESATLRILRPVLWC